MTCGGRNFAAESTGWLERKPVQNETTGMAEMIRRWMLYAVLPAAATGALASGDGLVVKHGINQSNFSTVAHRLGILPEYDADATIVPHGASGFDLGLSTTSYESGRSAWDLTDRDDGAPARLTMSRIHARKGLLEGTTVTPAVSVTGHYSQLTGVDELDLAAYGIDLGISKGFAQFTPYGGIGQVWYDGRENVDSLTLSDRNTSHLRSYLGMRVGLLPFLSVTAQADFAEINSYSLRLNLGF